MMRKPKASFRRWIFKMIACLAIVLLTYFISFRHVVHASFQDAYLEVCGIVETRFYLRAEPDVLQWIEKCYERAFQLPHTVSKTRVIGVINSHLEELGVSHLFLYQPEENRQLWEHEGLDNGLRLRGIDGGFYVYRILKGSSAEQAGVKVGDELISFNGGTPPPWSQVQSYSGTFSFRRSSARVAFVLQASELAEDQAPALVMLNEEIGLLQIPSFLPRYFERETWRPMARRLSTLKTLAVDLRGNAGGSFPAMLRAISPLECVPQEIGRIWQGPIKAQDRTEYMRDNLDANSQLEQLWMSTDLRLRSFADYGCFRGKLIVLVDSFTSSVAEIFAGALSERRQTEIWGVPTAGQVVMAQWFPVTALGGPDYSLSVPIATFRNRRGEELESTGVYPDLVLTYQRMEAERGIDSWVQRVIEDARRRH